MFKKLKLCKFNFNSLNAATSQLCLSNVLCMQREDDIVPLAFQVILFKFVFITLTEKVITNAIIRYRYLISVLVLISA